jgi:surface carbohydrate biosynthesis protein
MMNKNQEKLAFYFDVEIKKRELLSRLTIAALLAEKGYHVFIGERATLSSIGRIIPRATIVRKSAKSNSVTILSDLIKSGYKIVNIEEEGVLVGSLNEYIGVNMPPDAVKLPDRHLLWGDKQADHLKNLYPRLKDKFLKVGNPRLHLWKNRYYGFYDLLADDIKKEFGEFVLISSNFPYYTNSKHVKEMLAITGFLEKSENTKIYEENFKIVEFLFKEFLKAAKEISLKGIKVIFRPHPSESISKIQEYFSGYDNIIVRSDHDVAPWILASKAVIHNCCTSGLEAAVMKKNTIAYTPNSVSQYKLNNVDKIAKVALNVDELLEGIFTPTEFHPSMMNLDGYLIDKVSLDDIVNALESVQTKSFFDLSSVVISNNRYQFNKFFYTSIRKFKDYFIFDKVKKQERSSVRAKFPYTSALELEDYLSFIYEYGLLKQPITCVPVERNTFYIYCNNRNSD